MDFVYDAMGNMLSATPQDGEPVTLEYNSLSLRTKINDPSVGEITSEYNGFGYLLQSSQCVHKAGDTIVSRQTYNEAGQLVESQIGNQTLKYVYDAYGRPVSCGNDIHEQSIVYDKVGNIASVAKKIDGLTFLKSKSRSAHSRRRQLAQLQPLPLLPRLYISRNFFNSSIFSFAASLPIW
ncbi:MAG: hypothetical protein K6E14_03390 [Paludibacteraceae bacterium]|nr:hypothetical protein [Paludibacteraceae bacterium]